ncbi:MAG: restriction endonuclease [Phycisphaeraceae bacterium]
MARRQKEGLLGDFFALLVLLPAWVGPVLAAAAWLGVRYFLPALLTHEGSGIRTGDFLAPMLSNLAWIAGGSVMLVWLAAEWHKHRQRRLLDRQADIESTRSLSWAQFERLVTEAYRRQGYRAEHTGSPAGDGGVDVVLTGCGVKALVQCKQWRAKQVGVAVVRELLGSVTAEQADRGILVSSGRFTAEARRFARKHDIELIDGPALAAMIRCVQNEPAPAADELQPVAGNGSAQAPNCPACGSTMVQRTARRGERAGQSFWGCSRFPACRGTRAEV